MAPSRTTKPSPPASSLGFGATKAGVKNNKTKKPSLSPVHSFRPTREDDEVEIISVGRGAGGKAGSRLSSPRAALLKASNDQMGNKMVQEESLNWTPEQLILHIFDTDDSYGPAACGNRLDRFRRAQRLGLNPPAEVEVILDEALARAADEERKGAKANKARLREARLLNRPYTASPLDAEE